MDRVVADEAIARAQTAFLKHRYIMEGVIVLHETVNSIYKNKNYGLLLKIDFEKAYNKIKWPCLYQVMKMKGFPASWCDWIMQVVRGDKVGVEVNDEIGPYFKIFRGLRQGEPLSPLPFDIADDALAIMVGKAQQQGLIKRSNS